MVSTVPIELLQSNHIKLKVLLHLLLGADVRPWELHYVLGGLVCLFSHQIPHSHSDVISCCPRANMPSLTYLPLFNVLMNLKPI